MTTTNALSGKPAAATNESLQAKEMFDAVWKELMNERGADGLHFPEGPVAMADGSVIVVEMKRGTLTRVRTDGKHEINFRFIRSFRIMINIKSVNVFKL